MNGFFTSFTGNDSSPAKRNAWLAFLIAATIGLSCLFTCATPFSALAAVAALTLSRRQAIVFILAAFATNQFVGFAFKGYPHDAMTLTWGAIIGVAALVSALFACLAEKLYRAQPSPILSTAATFIAAFFGFQLVLLLANLTPLGSMDTFALATKARILLINVAALGAIWLANRTAIALRLLPAQEKSAAVAA